MKTDRFKDLLFQILNENDTFIDDIETDDENNFFLIRCIDHTNFVLQIHKAVPHFMIKKPPSQQTSFETYIQNSTKKDYFCELDMLALSFCVMENSLSEIPSINTCTSIAGKSALKDAPVTRYALPWLLSCIPGVAPDLITTALRTYHHCYDTALYQTGHTRGRNHKYHVFRFRLTVHTGTYIFPVTKKERKY